MDDRHQFTTLSIHLCVQHDGHDAQCHAVCLQQLRLILFLAIAPWFLTRAVQCTVLAVIFFSKFTRAVAQFPMIRPKYDSVSISSVADQLNESEFQ